jgi:predicted dehydrogenase
VPAPSPDNTHRALLWLSPDQAALLADACEQAGVTPALVGSSEAGAAQTLASELNAEPAGDLRQALLNDQIDLALFAGADEADLAVLDDRDLRKRCLDNALRILTLEPWPSSVLRAGDEQRAGARAGEIAFIPRFRRAPGARAMDEVLEAFGPPELVGLSFRAGPGQGSLAARMVDAMDAAVWLLGEPETIDASVRGPRSRAGLHLEPGESLRQLKGAASVHLRYADGRSVAMTLADNAGHWFRGLTLLGEKGCIRVDEIGFEWIDPTGDDLDRYPRERRGKKGGATAFGASHVLSDALTRALSRADAGAPPDLIRPLAMTEAAMLSARTGQPESPRTILRMAGVA